MKGILLVHMNKHNKISLFLMGLTFQHNLSKVRSYNKAKELVIVVM